MNFLWQRSWHTQVVRNDQNSIAAWCHYLDSDEEKKAFLQVRVGDFTIEKAELIELGRPGQLGESVKNLSAIEGIAAYLGSGPRLREILQPLLNAQERELLNQCVIGLIQADTFLFAEHGYQNSADYSRDWEDFYKGSCRYYSNLETITQSWEQYMGPQERKQYLYDRFKSQQLLEYADEWVLAGSLTDTFHHLSSLLWVGMADGCVRQADGALLKAPDQVCRQANQYLKTLPGINLLELKKKELAQQLGAGQGCVHLIDLIHDSAETLRIFLQTRQ